MGSLRNLLLFAIESSVRFCMLMGLLTMASSAFAQSDDVLIQQINVVDVDNGEIIPDQWIVIRDGIITDIGTAPENITDSVTLIDGKDKYLVPGLIDAHVHTHDENDLALFLIHGITSVRILDGTSGDLRRRDATESVDPIPRSFVCRQVDRVRNQRAARNIVNGAIEDGYDCLKVYSPPPWEIDDYHTLVTESIAAGIPLGGHLPRNIPLTQLLEGPMQGSVAHLEEFLYNYFFLPENRNENGPDPDSASQIAELLSSQDVFVITTLDQYRTIGLVAVGDYDTLNSTGDLELMPERIRRDWRGDRNRYRETISPDQGSVLLQQLYPHLQRLVVELDDKGINLVAGTDSSRNIPFSAPGLSYHRELIALSEAGLSNAAVLKAATINAAALLGEADLGLIAEGNNADLLLLSDNPLTDLTHLAGIEAVIKAGVVFRSEELNQDLSRIKEDRQ